MEISDLFLRKEEIKIIGEMDFIIPIHPKLLDPKSHFNPNIAQEVFRKTANEWHKDLMVYTNNLEENHPGKEWFNSILKNKPKIIEDLGMLVLERPRYESMTMQEENGFTRVFSIERNYGGTLYFNGASGFNPGKTDFLNEGNNRRTNFKKGKLKNFAIEIKEINGKEGFEVHKYSSHNILSYPGALFLRNWAINYMNETFKQHKEIFVKE